ncbi:urease accessory protein UreD [Streptomyces olivaceiscleroticus]|uniref:Urease accessory protein UreD n=1 Tax=Streptomyces olivaceiscleroticus TaxID=68245 RepID=A0ABN0ZG16_9ACTN
MTLAPPPIAPAGTAAPVVVPPAAARQLRATARIAAVAAPSGASRLPVLDGAGPLALRRLASHDGAARVCVVGAMSAPVGGDRLRIEAAAGPGSDLRVTAAAATLALPGHHPGTARYDVALDVADGARLDWLPEPLITAAGSDLIQTTTVDLAASARLVLREEQVLGRAGEDTGRLTARLTVRRAGRVLLDQETAYGPGVPAWDTAAVLAGHRAVGQLLVVDPAYEEEPVPVRVLAAPDGAGEAVVTPLAGPAALVTAVAPDALAVRRLLDAAAIPTGW